MKWFILLISLISSLQVGISQSEGTLDIHFVPLPLYDRNPRLRLGMEYRGWDRLGYSLELGFGNSHLNKEHLSKTIFGKDYSFFEVQAELKLYMHELGAVSKYFAADLFYLHMKDELAGGNYYPALRDDAVYFEKASFMKQKIGLLVKGGFKWLLWKRVALEIYQGVGIALRDIQYNDLEGAVSLGDVPLTIEWWTPPVYNEGNVVIGQFATGIKVGFVIARPPTP